MVGINRKNLAWIPLNEEGVWKMRKLSAVGRPGFPADIAKPPPFVVLEERRNISCTDDHCRRRNQPRLMSLNLRLPATNPAPRSGLGYVTVP